MYKIKKKKKKLEFPNDTKYSHDGEKEKKNKVWSNLIIINISHPQERDRNTIVMRENTMKISRVLTK